MARKLGFKNIAEERAFWGERSNLDRETIDQLRAELAQARAETAVLLGALDMILAMSADDLTHAKFRTGATHYAEKAKASVPERAKALLAVVEAAKNRGHNGLCLAEFNGPCNCNHKRLSEALAAMETENDR